MDSVRDESGVVDHTDARDLAPSARQPRCSCAHTKTNERSGRHLEAKKDERQEMPAARPSCAHDTQTWFVVPSTSVGPVGHRKKKTIPA